MISPTFDNETTTKKSSTSSTTPGHVHKLYKLPPLLARKLPTDIQMNGIVNLLQ